MFLTIKLNREILPDTIISKKQITDIVKETILENNLTDDSKIVNATVETILKILVEAKLIKIED